jgi:Sigma-70, region 4
MDELHGFCVRMLGPGDAARAAEQAARAAGQGDRVEALTAAATACRARDEAEPARAWEGSDPPGEPSGLAQAVARELALATAKLPERQREALALRELLGLPHEEIARVVGIENLAVAPLLARARLRLRAELRGHGEPRVECLERDRALRTIALRQDSEGVTAADDDWLVEHLGHCSACARAHAAMLEASVCYRAWRLEDVASPSGSDRAQTGPPGARPDR